MKKIATLLCVLLLGGCSTKFAYNNIDWLVYWYLDDYVVLNDTQEAQFDVMLANWIIWHKKEELPRYQLQLNEIIDDVKNRNITHERVAYHREKARTHWERARGHVAPDLVALGKTLDEEQIVYLFASLEKELKEDKEEMMEGSDDTPEERKQKWIDRNEDNITGWIGKLSVEQKEFIALFRERFESTGVLWLEYKRDYQQALRQTFAMQSRSLDFETRLLDLIRNPEQFRSEAFNQASDSNMQASSEYLVGLFERSSSKQLTKLMDEIDDLKDDVISLQK